SPRTPTARRRSLPNPPPRRDRRPPLSPTTQGEGARRPPPPTPPPPPPPAPVFSARVPAGRGLAGRPRGERPEPHENAKISTRKTAGRWNYLGRKHTGG